MAGYAPDKHHRRSIRLKDYDYARPGAYFVTICVQDRECLLGDIVDGEMRLNEAGRMVQFWWDRLPEKFPVVETDESVIMPNHFHGIIFIVEPDTGGANPNIVGANPNTVGANPNAVGANPNIVGVNPNTVGVNPNTVGANPNAVGANPNIVGANPNIVGANPNTVGANPNTVGANPCVRPNAPGQTRGSAQPGQTRGSAPTLGEIVQWFKTMTTNAYIRGVKQNGWQPFPGKLWQRNYYERIIRTERELNAIRQYIRANPARWTEDTENLDRVNAKR